MILKQKRKILLARVMLLLFVLGSALGTAAVMGNSSPGVALPTQAVVSMEQMKAPGFDSGMTEMSGSAVVTATYLNVRSGPNASYSIVGTLKNKDVVTLLGKFSNNWYKIKYANNKLGYVTGVYLEISSGSGGGNAPPPSGVDNGMTVFNGEGTTTTDLNVRSGPSTAYDKIGVLPDGTKVVLVGKFPTNWYKIKYSGGYAYVSGTYLKAVTQEPGTTTAPPPDNTTDKGMAAFDGTAVTTGNLNVRKGPATSYTILGVLSTKTKVTLVGKFTTGWYKIKYQSGYAYVSGSYLGSITSSGGNTDPGTDAGMTAYSAQGTVKESLNVRKGPGVTNDIIGLLQPGTKIKTVGKFTNGWYKIQYNNGFGYVSGDYVKIDSVDGTTTTTGSTTTTTKPNVDTGLTDFTAKGKTTDNLNVRTGPTTSYTKIGVIAKGTAVNIVGKFSSNWYKIKYNSGYAYVCGTYVDLSTEPNLPANPLDDVLWIPTRKPMPSSYVPAGLVNLKTAYGLPVSGTQYLVSEAASAYNELYKAAKAAGVLSSGDMVANSAYRSYAAQQSLYNSIANKQQVSKPGQSEHQMGVAIDIAQKNYSTFVTSPLCAWLKINAYKYGFILRYTSDKTPITGIIDEPWHYRYVGKSYAKSIYDSKKCLEEYVDSL